MAGAATETSTQPVGFQEAFRMAKEEHSPAEHALAPEDSTEAIEEEPPAGDGDDDTAEGTEADTTASVETETNDLVSDDEFATLTKTHDADPAALRQALNKAFTQKTQAFSAERKTFERLKPYTEIIDSLEADGPGTLAALAKEYGFSLTPLTGGKAEGADEGKAAASESDAVDTILDGFREKLGPDLEYLADGLLPAVKDLVEKLTTTQVGAVTKPLIDHLRDQTAKEAETITTSTMAAFGEKHPDWQTHEPAMMELAKGMDPKGLTESEYLERLYKLATYDTFEKTKETSIAEGVKKAIKRQQMGAASTETRERTTPETQVKNRPQGVPTFQDAAEAAKRGERWE